MGEMGHEGGGGEVGHGGGGGREMGHGGGGREMGHGGGGPWHALTKKALADIKESLPRLLSWMSCKKSAHIHITPCTHHSIKIHIQLPGIQ